MGRKSPVAKLRENHNYIWIAVAELFFFLIVCVSLIFPTPPMYLFPTQSKSNKPAIKGHNAMSACFLMRLESILMTIYDQKIAGCLLLIADPITFIHHNCKCTLIATTSLLLWGPSTGVFMYKWCEPTVFIVSSITSWQRFTYVGVQHGEHIRKIWAGEVRSNNFFKY